MRRMYFLLGIFIVAASAAAAQSSSNPDISVIPRFRIESNDAGGTMTNPDFRLDEFELAIQSYLNPYSRADIFLTKPGLDQEPIEIEEAYVTFVRGLPWDINLKIGKHHTEFGKLNALHPHAWPFLSKPPVLERFLGDEGANDLSIGASILLPLSDEIYSRLSLDLLRGKTTATMDPSLGATWGGIGQMDTLNRFVPYAAAGRYMVFLSLGDVSDLELGLSGMTGIHDPYRSLRFYYSALDFKYKWKPDAYTGLTVQGEALLNQREVFSASTSSLGTVTSSGAYIYGDYQFQKIYSLGVRLDWSQAPYSADDRATGFSIFAGFYPVEETTAFRLEYQRQSLNTPGAGSTVVNTIGLQFMFSMGPHKAHPF
jgi:hypothetical protein